MLLLDCFATGSVTGGNGANRLGGLCGYHLYSSIKDKLRFCFYRIGGTGSLSRDVQSRTSKGLSPPKALFFIEDTYFEKTSFRFNGEKDSSSRLARPL